MLAALLTTGFFAVTAVFARRAALLLGATAANFWRLLLATAVLGAWTALAGRGLGVAWGWFLLGGVAGFGLGGLAMFHSLPRAGSNLSTLTVQCGSVAVALVGEWLLLGTAPSGHQLVCIGAILAGVLLGLAPGGLPQFEPRQLRIGAALAALSACGQGAGQVFSRKAFAVALGLAAPVDPVTAAFERGVAGLLVAALALGAVWAWRRRRSARAGAGMGATCHKGLVGSAPSHAGSPTLPYGSPTPSAFRLQPSAFSPAWHWVGLNALTGPVLGVVCLQWALRSTPAGVVQSVVALAPLLTAALAWRMGEAVPRWRYFVGAGLAVAATVALFWPRIAGWLGALR
jgi:drug/metabolite transporter (DMT)-like permease